GIGRVAQHERDRQRLAQRLRILECDLKLDVSEVHTPESLGHAQLFGMRMTRSIQPRAIVEPRAVDDERVAVPASDRVSEPARIRIRRQDSPVDEDLTVSAGAAFVQQTDY